MDGGIQSRNDYRRIVESVLVMPTWQSRAFFCWRVAVSLQEWLALAIAAGTLAALVGVFWLMSPPNDRKQ